MDSMRSLNTSLPGSHSRRRAGRTPHNGEVLQAFRTAALSVTQLYKSALADQQNSRAAGYQEAIEDLLNFLDDENLGVGDGEGWRVRQWATERASPASFARSDDDDDDDSSENSPTPQPGPSERVEVPAQTSHHKQPRPEPAAAEAHSSSVASSGRPSAVPIHTTPAMFHFQAEPQISFQQAMDVDGNHTSDTVAARTHRGLSRGSHMGAGAGQKRKQNFADFFDLGSISVKDLGANGNHFKRGRHT